MGATGSHGAAGSHVTLLFPPPTDPRNPHLALPALAGALRAAGVRVTMRDLDLEALLWLLEPDRLAVGLRACCEVVTARGRGGRDSERIQGLVRHVEQVFDAAVRGPATLRDPATFFDPWSYRNAREAICAALDMISVGFGDVRYNVTPAAYEVRGRDAARLADLLAVTADPSLDLFHEFYLDRLLPDLDRDRPAAVGIAILNYQQVIPGLSLARLLKDRGHTVIIGGTVYAKFVDRLLELPRFFQTFCHGLVAYEGETAMLGLLEALDGDGDLGRVPNLVSLDPGGRPRLGPHHLEDVNALPTPDFTGLPLERYLSPALVLPILMGKGCYFNKCKFCDIPFINRTSIKSYRLRSCERVAADIAALHERHGVRLFEFIDEALAPKLLLRLGEALREHPDVHPLFSGFARFEATLTEQTCEDLYAMGVRKFYFGLESGSQTTLDHMRKGIRVDVAERVLANCRTAQIAFHIFSMIGFPEETEDLARETIDFFVRNREIVDEPCNSFDIHRFALDLRTDYGEHPERYGVRLSADPHAAPDFPLSAEGWVAERGLSAADVERLIAEFEATLLGAYRTSHAYPVHLWPDWGTHSLLYSEHYEARPFSHRATLPPAGDPLRFSLLWTAGVDVSPEAPGYRVACITGSGLVSRAHLLVLARPRPFMTVDELLERLTDSVGERDRLREVIDGLLLIGAIRLDADPVVAPEQLPPVAVLQPS